MSDDSNDAGTVYEVNCNTSILYTDQTEKPKRSSGNFKLDSGIDANI